MEEYKGMKVGDLISTYYSGYHRLEKIEQRFYKSERDIPSFMNKKVGDEYSPLFHFIQMYKADGTAVKTSKIKVCDSTFCKPAEQHITAKVADLEKEIKQLNNILEK